MKVLEIGVFPLKAETKAQDFEPVVAFSAKIGARYLVCPIEDDDKARRVATFAGVCDLAARYGMEALVEFNPYSGCRSLGEAAELAREAGRPNGKLLIDVLHLSRSGGSPEDARKLDPALVPLVHFCDAPPRPTDDRSVDELRRESRTARLLPGEGSLWLDRTARRPRRPTWRSASRRPRRATRICRRASGRGSRSRRRRRCWRGGPASGAGCACSQVARASRCAMLRGTPSGGDAL